MHVTARSGALLLLVSALGACAAPHTDIDLPAASTASTGAQPTQALRIRDQRIPESSGLAPSPAHAGVLYTHNDRGNPPHIFAVGSAGTRAVLRLFGAPRGDWEDIATTPDGRIWVGDIGDRPAERQSIAVYTVKEPESLTTRDVQWVRYELVYEDGPRNAEALLVSPRASRLYVVSKERDGGSIYEATLPLSETGPNTLKRVRAAPANITAGDFAPQGRSFALRNYRAAYYYEDIRTNPVVARLPDQVQGESLTFTTDGTMLLVGSEGLNSPVFRVPLPRDETSSPSPTGP